MIGLSVTSMRITTLCDADDMPQRRRYLMETAHSCGVKFRHGQLIAKTIILLLVRTLP